MKGILIKWSERTQTSTSFFLPDSESFNWVGFLKLSQNPAGLWQNHFQTTAPSGVMCGHFKITLQCPSSPPPPPPPLPPAYDLSVWQTDRWHSFTPCVRMSNGWWKRGEMLRGDEKLGNIWHGGGWDARTATEKKVSLATLNPPGKPFPHTTTVKLTSGLIVLERVAILKKTKCGFIFQGKQKYDNNAAERNKIRLNGWEEVPLCQWKSCLRH